MRRRQGPGALHILFTDDAAAHDEGQTHQGPEALEPNSSCPNMAEDLACDLADGLARVRAVKAALPNLFLIAKISIRQPYEFAQELVRAGVRAQNASPRCCRYEAMASWVSR